MTSLRWSVAYGCLFTLQLMMHDSVRGSKREQTEIQRNATQLLNQLLAGYDNRKRPGFGVKFNNRPTPL